MPLQVNSFTYRQWKLTPHFSRVPYTRFIQILYPSTIAIIRNVSIFVFFWSASQYFYHIQTILSRTTFELLGVPMIYFLTNNLSYRITGKHPREIKIKRFFTISCMELSIVMQSFCRQQQLSHFIANKNQFFCSAKLFNLTKKYGKIQR